MRGNGDGRPVTERSALIERELEYRAAMLGSTRLALAQAGVAGFGMLAILISNNNEMGLFFIRTGAVLMAVVIPFPVYYGIRLTMVRRRLRALNVSENVE